MKAVLFVGSPRVRSNTRSIVVALRTRLEASGADVVVIDPSRGGEAQQATIDDSIGHLLEADALVIASPVYLDAQPYRALAWFEGLLAQRDSLSATRPSVYAICHSGYFEPVHKDVSLRVIEHLCERLGWPWRGGLAFGGTSPIDGNPLEEAGPFSRRIRPALDALVPILLSRRDIPRSLQQRAARSPIPLPRRLVVWIMNRALART